MLPERLDFLFPFLVFFYGFLLVFVLEVPLLTKASRGRMAVLSQHLEPKRKWAWICLFVGGLWSLQNLLFT